MARMTGATALVRSLIGHGVDTIFGLPGVQLDPLFNALHDEGNRIRVLQTRHEQAAAYMAFGYAQATGKVGAFAVVPGPGILNAGAALATAYGANSRVLAIVGQIPSQWIGRAMGMLHEIPDQLGFLQSLTKWAARVEHPALAPDMVDDAMRQLMTGRPRPVALEIAPDVLARQVDIELPEPAANRHWKELAPDPDLVARAAKLLGEAEKPLITVGSGALDSAAEVRALAEMLQAPVMAHRMGRGIMDARHDLAVTLPTGFHLWQVADVVLALGTRLQFQRQAWDAPEDQKLIQVDVDPSELSRHGRPAVGLAAHVRPTLVALLEAVPAHNRKRSPRGAETAALRSKVEGRIAEALAPQVAYMRAIREALPEDGILVEELTQIGYAAQGLFPAYHPRSYISSGYQGTLGFGYATALGAQVGAPDRPVLSVNGDGGFMYTATELATAVLHNLPVVAVVFDDSAYGNVRRMQEEMHGGRVIASDLRNPHFAAMAESFGAAGYRAETPDELRNVIEEAFAAKVPAVVHVKLGKLPDPWPHLRPTGRPA